MEYRLRLSGGQRWAVKSAGEVRHVIAQVMLRPGIDDIRIGSITLHPHQRSAVERLDDAIDQFGGALLCDDVGMGKTYVALAIARRFRNPLIVAPAALVGMWGGALRTTGVGADIVTFESLSRMDSDDQRVEKRAQRPRDSDLVVVDEAHHVRNPRTNRYIALESIVRGAKVLLMSATPVHNRREDLVAILALFLGSRAYNMTSSELALCVVRREHRQVSKSVPIPRLLPTIHHAVPDAPELVQQLMALPAPIPARDGGIAAALISRGLVHQWASSEAAFDVALRKRIARATALCISLEAGTYPTNKELETWIYGDGALQLGFAELLASAAPGHHELLSGIRAHRAALEQILERVSTSRTQSSAIPDGGPAHGDIDQARVRVLVAIKNANPRAKIVAFAQYAETVSMLFRRLSQLGRIAMLTSHGARVAGGSLTRREAITRFAPRANGANPPPVAEEIRLLLTTDLLSEGVNLQDADTVVHLDVPWTAARMGQRVGRVARLGSFHSAVHVHVLRPPASGQKVLDNESIVSRKWQLARSGVGTSSGDPVFTRSGFADQDERVVSVPTQTEQLRSILGSWLAEEYADPTEPNSPGTTVRKTALVATVVGTERFPAAATARAAEHFLAAVSYGGRDQLLVGDTDGVTTDLSSQIAACSAFGATDKPTDPAAVRAILDRINSWLENEDASAAAGVAASNAQNRNRIVERIDSAIEMAPPHERAALLPLAARARQLAVSPQCAAVERDLQSLLQADMPAKEWLAAVAGLDGRQAIENVSDQNPVIHAILISSS
jgi:superfamily II DNA or RNA helicase